jgi:hypothetical protein
MFELFDQDIITLFNQIELDFCFEVDTKYILSFFDFQKNEFLWDLIVDSNDVKVLLRNLLSNVENFCEPDMDEKEEEDKKKDDGDRKVGSDSILHSIAVIMASKSERPSAVPNCSLAGGHCWRSPLDLDPLEQGAMEGESPV